jgi:hypothetical protein
MDLLRDAQLLYLTENIDDGYESSMVKSCISLSSKRSDNTG